MANAHEGELELEFEEEEIETAPLPGSRRGSCNCQVCRARNFLFHESVTDDGSAEFESPTAKGWTGSPEQIDFRERVLRAHIDRSRAQAIRKGKSGDPAPDVPKDQLGPVAGTARGPNGLIYMRKDASEWAGRLLEAANRALAKAKQEGVPDALLTVGITANSGNRSRAEQQSLWRRYFSRTKPPGYYDQTLTARQALPGGPHSAAAVSYMLDKFRVGNRIAAPGYSNHNGGIAVDLWQYRTKGFEVRNQTDKGYPNGGGPNWKRWRATWLFKWLTANAASFRFYPYMVEPWHWEYGPSGPTREFEVPHRSRRARRSVPSPRVPAGKIGGFASSTLPIRIAVYCPKEALSRSSVDVILYAHGLNSGQCGEPAKTPEDFITKPPFSLGTIVDDSLSGAVLVVPFMDWEILSRNGMGFGPKDRRGNPRWHKLAIPSKFNKVLAEALGKVGQLQGFGTPSLRRLIIAGHSRAYDFLDPLANAFADPEMLRGALGKLSAVWAFDTTYSGPVADWEKWLHSKPDLKLSLFFRPGPGSLTSVGAQRFASAALKRGSRITKPTPVPETHCSVPGRRLPALLAALALNPAPRSGP